MSPAAFQESLARRGPLPEEVVDTNPRGDRYIPPDDDTAAWLATRPDISADLPPKALEWLRQNGID